MSLIALLLLGIAVVPAFGVAMLGWLALQCDNEDIGFYIGSEELNLEM